MQGDFKRPHSSTTRPGTCSQLRPSRAKHPTIRLAARAHPLPERAPALTRCLLASASSAALHASLQDVAHAGLRSGPVACLHSRLLPMRIYAGQGQTEGGSSEAQARWRTGATAGGSPEAGAPACSLQVASAAAARAPHPTVWAGWRNRSACPPHHAWGCWAVSRLVTLSPDESPWNSGDSMSSSTAEMQVFTVKPRDRDSTLFPSSCGRARRGRGSD